MTYTLHRGAKPLLVSLPHVGTFIPDPIKARLVGRAQATEDTDWFLDRLYAFVKDLGASLIVPVASRYVIDLNRPSENTPMYAGSNNTELCPTHFFSGDVLYRDGLAPTTKEIEERVATWWLPYHDALRAELARIHTAHGHAVLFDGHSIKSDLPWLFEGQLPHMNLGTADGASCAAGLTSRLAKVFAAEPRYAHVVNGRFKGGHITRHYGAPHQGIHAVQLEMCWRAYMDEAPPYRWHEERAAAVTPLLRRLMQTLLDGHPNAA